MEEVEDEEEAPEEEDGWALRLVGWGYVGILMWGG